jgi:hypothetical protein
MLSHTPAVSDILPYGRTVVVFVSRPLTPLVLGRNPKTTDDRQYCHRVILAKQGEREAAVVRNVVWTEEIVSLGCFAMLELDVSCRDTICKRALVVKGVVLSARRSRGLCLCECCNYCVVRFPDAKE